MEEEIKLLNNAFETYNLDNRDELSDKILSYIAERLLVNKSYINQLIELLGEKITFKEIWKTFELERSSEDHYKETIEFRKFSSNYFMGVYTTSKGNIVIETDDILDIIKYFVTAIKTRNTITISKVDYREVSIESVLLVIFCEALNKFGLDRNLIMIMPYEECYYENYDEVIINENGKQSVENKAFSNKYVIYIEDNNFKKDVEEEKKRLTENGFEYEIIEDEFYNAIRKINKIRPLGSCIYTSNPEQGYKFINLVHSNNVFVNTSLLNSEKDNKTNNLYYMRKKMIYPMTDYGVTDSNETIISENTQETIQSESVGAIINRLPLQINSLKNTQNNLTEENNEYRLTATNSWYKKIIETIKNFFKK